jgi:hypothetical protein
MNSSSQIPKRYHQKNNFPPNFTQLTEAIEKVTDALTQGNRKEMTPECITIEMTGPDLANLTIVDLPGIVRTIADGTSRFFLSMVGIFEQ